MRALPAIERSAATLFRGSSQDAVADGDVSSADFYRPLAVQRLVWVAENQGRLVGFVACEMFEDALQVWELGVAREAQRQGLGRALMGAAIDEARRRGCPAVTFNTFRDISWNGPFYARLGFVEIPETAFNDRLAFIREREVKVGLDVAAAAPCGWTFSPRLEAPRPSGLTAAMAEETRLIRAGAAPKELAKTVAPPIQKGSTVLLPDARALYDDEHYVTYGRQGLAAHDALREALGVLEGAVGVALYPSGVAAITGALLAVLKAGDEILVVDTIYKPTRRFCDHVLKRFGVATTYYDARTSPEDLVASASDKTRLILMESPGSLSFEMQDMARVAELARARGILTAADNTWAAGLVYKPLEHGVDISIQALTKYVGGHSDVFMGSAAARDPAIVRALKDGVLHMGWAVAPEDAYMMLRGVRTLATRMARHGESGLAVARWLADQPEVAQVLHPALPGAPGHELWRRDYTGACGLFGFVLQPAPRAAVEAFLDSLTLFGLGFSWGGFESLAIDCDPQLKTRKFNRDYGGPLMRLHIGLEDPQDLMADLRAALDAYAAAAR